MGKRVKVFISGKVSGMEYYTAFSKFSEAEAILSRIGYEVVNPTKLCRKNWSWIRCMIVCLWHLIGCKCVYQLDNWQESRGAKIEYKWAKFLGKKIL